MAQYEGSQQGVTWGSVHEGPFPLSASLAFLAPAAAPSALAVALGRFGQGGWCLATRHKPSAAGEARTRDGGGLYRVTPRR